MLGSLILYLKGMRIMMFQLSGFYCTASRGLGGFGLFSGSGCVGFSGLSALKLSQRAQYPLITEYTLNH